MTTARTRATSPAPDPAGGVISRESPALAITGFLMLLVLFLNANPFFGRHAMWPWEMFTRSPAGLFLKAEVVLWTVAGLWALVMAFTRAQRARSTIAVSFALVLMLHCLRPESGLHVRRFYLNDLIPLIGMGTGFLLVLRPGSAGLGRVIAGISALGFIGAYLVGFHGNELTPRYLFWVEDLQAVFTGGELSSEEYGYGWRYVVPQLLLFITTGAAILVALGVSARKFLIAAFSLLAVAVVAPIPVRITGALTRANPDAQQVVSEIFSGLTTEGVLIWLFATVALSDMARSQEGEA